MHILGGKWSFLIREMISVPLTTATTRSRRNCFWKVLNAWRNSTLGWWITSPLMILAISICLPPKTWSATWSRWWEKQQRMFPIVNTYLAFCRSSLSSGNPRRRWYHLGSSPWYSKYLEMRLNSWRTPLLNTWWGWLWTWPSRRSQS